MVAKAGEGVPQESIVVSWVVSEKVNRGEEGAREEKNDEGKEKTGRQKERKKENKRPRNKDQVGGVDTQPPCLLSSV